MLSDKKYGLSVNIMATRVTPSLLPQTVNPSLNLEQFTILIEVIEKMTSNVHVDAKDTRREYKINVCGIKTQTACAHKADPDSRRHVYAAVRKQRRASCTHSTGWKIDGVAHDVAAAHVRQLRAEHCLHTRHVQRGSLVRFDQNFDHLWIALSKRTDALEARFDRFWNFRMQWLFWEYTHVERNK